MSQWWTYAESTGTVFPRGPLSGRSGFLEVMPPSLGVLNAWNSSTQHDLGKTFGGPGTSRNPKSCSCHVDAMGHTFDNDLVCGNCGRAWWAHVLEPTPCPGKPPEEQSSDQQIG